MRISDWSSDVCSSDLFDVDAGVVLRDHAARCRHAAPPAAGHAMIATTLFIVFIVLMVIGMPVGVALGIAGTLAIVMSNLDTQWFGLLAVPQSRSEEHTSELQSLMGISYAVCCWKKKMNRKR